MHFAVSIIAVCVMVNQAALAADAPQTRRPNVVLLLTDDQRPDTIAALGNKFITTPNIDKLVERGFIFRNTYCMGAMVAAVCLPSRTMLLSGKHLFHAKDQPSGGDPDTFTWPRAMKAAGYATLRSGKNDNHPKKIAGEFDQNFDIARRETCTEEHVNNGINFIREHAGQKPFFLDLEFGTPHDPQPAPAKYYAMYKADTLPLPPNFLPIHPFDNGEMTVRDEQTLPWPRTKESVTGKLARYYASISYTDAQIGRLLDVLKETRQLENTIIIYASDNGLSLGEHGLLGKQNLYENGGMSVPLIFTGPGIPKGESKAFAYLYDIFPTICELCGFRPPAKLDGLSLAPIIYGKAPAVRDHVFLAYRDVQRSVRDDRWKLIRYPHINKSQLFDLQNDPHELKDLAADPTHTDKVQQMMIFLAALQKELGDTCPLTSEKPGDPAWSPDKVKTSQNIP